MEFGEPLHKPEDDMEPLETEAVAEDLEADEAIDVDLEADTQAEAPAIEQAGQATELLKETPSNDEPVDLGDWEPTLF